MYVPSDCAYYSTSFRFCQEVLQLFYFILAYLLSYAYGRVASPYMAQMIEVSLTSRVCASCICKSIQNYTHYIARFYLILPRRNSLFTYMGVSTVFYVDNFKCEPPSKFMFTYSSRLPYRVLRQQINPSYMHFSVLGCRVTPKLEAIIQLPQYSQ